MDELGGTLVTATQITLLVLAILLVGGIVALYFVGKRMQKKQAE